MSFCAHFSLRDIDPTVNTMCLYVEFLARSFSSPKSIVNYIGGVRFLHKLLNVSSTALASFDLELMMRAINITMERKTPVRLPVTLEMLHALCEICDMLPPNGVVFKCVFLFAFFGFFRCSNLVPSSNAFDVTRNLCGGDVFITNGKLIILVKWSKTRQRRGHTQLVSLPHLRGHPLCPMTAYKSMCEVYPPRPNVPLFRINHDRKQTVLTANYLRRFLKAVIIEIGFSPKQFTMHSFRRGGATFCFNKGIELARIKSQGDWQSNAVWRYISTNAEGSAQFARDVTKLFDV